MALANSVCSDYIEGDQQFATALLGACMSLDSTPGCVSSEFEVETLDIDKTSCPKVSERRIANHLPVFLFRCSHA